MLVRAFHLSCVQVHLTFCRIFAPLRPSSSTVSPVHSLCLQVPVLSIVGIQLAKPSFVRILRGLVLPRRWNILTPLVILQVVGCCTTQWTLLLSDHLALLLLVTHRFDTSIIFSWIPLSSSHSHAVGILLMEDPTYPGSKGFLKFYYIIHSSHDLLPIRTSGHLGHLALLSLPGPSTPAAYHDVDKWVESNSSSTYSIRFPGHRSIQDPAKNTYCTLHTQHGIE